MRRNISRFRTANVEILLWVERTATLIVVDKLKNEFEKSSIFDSFLILPLKKLRPLEIKLKKFKLVFCCREFQNLRIFLNRELLKIKKQKNVVRGKR